MNHEISRINESLSKGHIFEIGSDKHSCYIAKSKVLVYPPSNYKSLLNYHAFEEKLATESAKKKFKKLVKIKEL